MGRNFFIYAAIVIGSMAIALDFASVDLAIPALQEQFGLNLQSVQWVINGYVLAFSVLMVAGGKLADAHGRKRVFLAGMGVFALASLLGGMAWSGGSVIAFRVLQGAGAALLWPAMIGLGCAAAGDARRSFVLGLIFGTCSLGNAAGPVVGGALTQWFSWRWVLWINVPMALFSMLVLILKVPRDPRSSENPKNDFAGMFLLTTGLVALMLFVYQVQPWGWSDLRVIGLLAVAVGMLAAFPFVERRAAEPLIPPDLLRNREIMTLCLCALVICQLFFIVLLYFTQYAMKFLGEDPMWAGARVVQFMLAYGLVSYFGGPLSSWFGTRRLLVIGLLCALAASIALGIFGPGAGPVIFNASLVLLGVGVGAVIPTVSARAIETAGSERASLVSGITFMCQLAGSALMLAINTAIFAAVSSRQLDEIFARENIVLAPADRATVEAVMTGAQTARAFHLPPAEALGNLTQWVSQAYQGGLQIVLCVSAGLVLVTLLAVLRFVPRAENLPK
jgi:EmrB/QacA subfamily drug resistance transporter